MRILVTRPQREAGRTAARLAALGHETLCAPILEIVATGATRPAGKFDALLATSAQAVSLLGETSARAVRDLPLFIVGARTAGAARAKGFADVRVPAPDAGRLAPVIIAAYAAPAKFLYLAGRDRKGDLEAALAARGHRIEVLVVYEARAAAALPQAAAEALRAGRIDAVLHYSARSAAIFRHLAETAGLAAAPQILHVCISEEAAAPLLGFATHLTVARVPNEAGLLAALGAKDDG